MVYIDVALEFWKLQVENDATERGVQLGHAYLGRTKIEENTKTFSKWCQTSTKKIVFEN